MPRSTTAVALSFPRCKSSPVTQCSSMAPHLLIVLRLQTRTSGACPVWLHQPPQCHWVPFPTQTPFLWWFRTHLYRGQLLLIYSNTSSKMETSIVLRPYFGIINDTAIIILVLKSCPILCDPMDYSLPGFSVHGIFQARILEWVAISFSRGSYRPRDQTLVSCITEEFFTICATTYSSSNNVLIILIQLWSVSYSIPNSHNTEVH